MVTAEALRIVFFGTPEFAVPTFNALLRSRHRIVGVVTQPDRPRGRGHRAAASAVKACALDAGLPVLQPERLKDPEFVGTLAGFDAGLGVVAAYGKILTEAVFTAPRLGMINVHASLLPRHRGAAPVHRALINGDRETGVTIMRIVKALDAGPMLATARRPVGPEETSHDVERDLARVGADLLVTIVDRLAEGVVEETPQDEARATYAPRLAKADGIIDWSLAAHSIHNLVRGLHPWPHAFTYWHGHRLILLRTHALDEPAGAEPGTVLDARGDRLHVAAGAGIVSVIEIQAEGKRPMGAREFLAGHGIARGERFVPQP